MKLISLIKNNNMFKNMSYLTALQMASYFFPLITYPFLNRVIGTAGVGVLYFSQSLISYFVLFVNYGFYLSGPRLIAIYRDDKDKVNEIFSAIMIIKTMLMLVSFVIVTTAALTVPAMKVYAPAFIVTMLSLVSEVAFPVWFFQGMEDMKYITILNVISKLIALILLILFVRHRTNFDLYLACAIQSLSGVIAGFMSFFIVFKKYKVRFILPKFKLFKEYMVENWNFFLAQFSTSIFAYSNGLLLGFFIKDKTVVGYYGNADKIVRAIVSLISPVTTAVYPTASRLFHKSVEEALKFLKKVLIYGTLFFLGVSVLLFIFAGFITTVLFAHYDPTVTTIIRILSLMPTTIFVNNIYGTQIMVNCGMAVKFRNIIVFSGIFMLISSIVLINLYSAIGAGISSLLAEILLAVLMMANIERNKRLRLLRPRVSFD